jgi:hypothetical protein
MLSFQPEPTVDGLMWECPHGHEAVRIPEMTQSWKSLKDEASGDRTETLPKVIGSDRDFALMFLLTDPHRLSPALALRLDVH